MLAVGFKQTYIAFQECMRLKQTFLYLIFYFLMYVHDFSGDCLNLIRFTRQGRCSQYYRVRQPLQYIRISWNLTRVYLVL